MDTIVHHDRETAYRVSDRGGTGPTICCVHGTGASNAVWKSQHRLSDEFPIVTVDCSGHGDSTDVATRPGFETISAYADDVLAVVEATDADVLLGHSLGGAVVQQLLVERSVDVDRAILANTGVRLPVPADLRSALDAEDGLSQVTEYLHEPGRLFADPSESLRTVSAAALADCGQSVLRRDFQTCHWFDYRDQLEGIDVPALAVAGRADQLTPPWYHRQLARLLSDCALAVVDEAAHLSMLERPTAFNDAVRRFLGNQG